MGGNRDRARVTIEGDHYEGCSGERVRRFERAVLGRTPVVRAPARARSASRVHAAGVNPVEVYIRNGGYAAYEPGMPYVPGFDAAGVVDAVGAGVDCAVGDRVFVASRDTGTYAEYVTADASSVWPLPAGVLVRPGRLPRHPRTGGAPRPVRARRAQGGRAGAGARGVRRGRLPGGPAGARGGGVRHRNGRQRRGRRPFVTSGSRSSTTAHPTSTTRSSPHRRARRRPDRRDARQREPRRRLHLPGDVRTHRRRRQPRRPRVRLPRLVMGKSSPTSAASRTGTPHRPRGRPLGDLAAKLADGSLVPRVGREFPLAEAAAARTTS